MVTLEDIETEIDSSKQDGIKNKLMARTKANILNDMIRRLKDQVELLKEIPDIDGVGIIKALINRDRVLTEVERDAVLKKFGTRGIVMLDGMGSMNRAQKQWVYKQMGWDIGEVR